MENNCNCSCNVEFDVGEVQFVNMGVSSYNELEDKPSINGVVLEDNKTLKELGIQPECIFEIAYGNLNSQANLEVLTKANKLIKNNEKFFIYLNKSGILYSLSSYQKNSTTQTTYNFELDVANDTKDTKEISKKEVISLYAINQLGYDNVISISEARSKKELYGYKNKEDMVFKTDIPDVGSFIDKDVDDLTNYTNNTELEKKLSEKANTKDIPNVDSFITK